MKLTTGSKAAFGLGAIGKDIVYMLISAYLLYFYNAVLGVNAVFIGSMMMAARIFDAFNDPIMGIIVAKTKTRWGRFRPFILAGTLLNAVTIFALFAPPENMAGSGLKIWLTVFYFLWGITYTMMDIPFWSMIPAITDPGHDRENLSSLARSCAGIGDAIPTVLTMLVVIALSGSDSIADFRVGFKWWALAIAVFFVFSEIVFVRFVPERPVSSSEKAPGPAEMFRSLFANDQAMTVVASVILVYTALNIVGNLLLYFFQFDLLKVEGYGVFTGVCFAVQVLVMMLFPLFRMKFGKTELFLAGFAVQIAGFLLILLTSFTGIYRSAWVILCIPGALVYAGYGILNVLLTIFLSDSVDYGEYKNGTREESVIFSLQTFTVKLASGLAIFAAGIILDAVKLNPEAASQSAATLRGLRLAMTVPSILLLTIGIIVYRVFYKLDEAKMAEITERLHEK